MHYSSRINKLKKYVEIYVKEIYKSIKFKIDASVFQNWDIDFSTFSKYPEF